MKKFKSYGFWTALSGAVVIFLNALGDCFGFSVDNDLVSALIMAVAGILVVLGVVSMPKDNNSSDDGVNSDENTPSETESKEDYNNEEDFNNSDDEKTDAGLENNNNDSKDTSKG